jgi:uncharacterized Zn-finger protein
MAPADAINIVPRPEPREGRAHRTAASRPPFLAPQIVPMQPFETIPVDSPVVACNGGGGPLGHPRVYLNLAGRGEIECPYCSRLFVLRGKPDETGAKP